jgi:hypothetical protein
MASTRRGDVGNGHAPWTDLEQTTGSRCAARKTALWPAEVMFSATVPRRAVEAFDMRVIGMALCEKAAAQMDRAFLQRTGASLRCATRTTSTSSNC